MSASARRPREIHALSDVMLLPMHLYMCVCCLYVLVFGLLMGVRGSLAFRNVQSKCYITGATAEDSQKICKISWNHPTTATWEVQVKLLFIYLFCWMDFQNLPKSGFTQTTWTSRQVFNIFIMTRRWTFGHRHSKTLKMFLFTKSGLNLIDDF